LDIKEYISSGILELYSAGALTDAEGREVETMASKYPEIKSELAQINEAVSSFGTVYQKSPRPELRSKIINKINSLESQEDNDNVSKPASDKPNVISMKPDRPAVRQTESSSKMKYLMAAVLAFLVLNIAGNFFLYDKWKGTENRMAFLVDENRKVKEEYNQIKNNMEKKNEDIKMVMNRSNKIVDLKGMDVSPNSYATVYWNPNSKKVMLNVDNLPPPPSNMQYQLWALKDGKPIDAGIFDMDKDPMHMMPVTIPAADAFAVTLEKKGGSPTPDLTKLYVMGKI